jgi:hypothetical protein
MPKFATQFETVDIPPELQNFEALKSQAASQPLQRAAAVPTGALGALLPGFSEVSTNPSNPSEALTSAIPTAAAMTASMMFPGSGVVGRALVTGGAGAAGEGIRMLLDKAMGNPDVPPDLASARNRMLLTGGLQAGGELAAQTGTRLLGGLGKKIGSNLYKNVAEGTFNEVRNAVGDAPSVAVGSTKAAVNDAYKNFQDVVLAGQGGAKTPGEIKELVTTANYWSANKQLTWDQAQNFRTKLLGMLGSPDADVRYFASRLVAPVSDSMAQTAATAGVGDAYATAKELRRVAGDTGASFNPANAGAGSDLLTTLGFEKVFSVPWTAARAFKNVVLAKIDGSPQASKIFVNAMEALADGRVGEYTANSARAVRIAMKGFQFTKEELAQMNASQAEPNPVTGFENIQQPGPQ